MALRYENSIKRVKLQHQAADSSCSAHQLLILFLLLCLYLSQRSLPAASQDNIATTNGKTSFVSSSSSFVGPPAEGRQSKTSNNLNTGFNFREHIVHLQRKQQQQQQQQHQVTEQKQHQVVEQQVQPASVQQQRVVVEQSIDSQQEQQQQLVGEQSSSSSTYGSIKGTPGVDFPAYSSIPNTRFSCAGAPFDPGMYADETTGCQVYHMCYQGRRESFLCGEGTVFNQAIMNCDFWHSVDCPRSSAYYNLNADFGKSASEPSVAGAGGSWSLFEQRVLQAAQLPSVSPPPVQRTFQLEEHSYSGSETKGGGNGGLIGFHQSARSAAPSGSLRDFQQFSSQREFAQPQIPLSPGRRANQLSGFHQSRITQSGKFSSAESSPMRSISATIDQAPDSLQVQPVEQVGASLTVANEPLGMATKGIGRVESQAGTSFASRKGAGGIEERPAQSGKSSEKQEGGKTSSLETTGKALDSANEEDTNDVWKPYFKSKTKTSSQGAPSKSGGGGKGGATQSRPKLPPSPTGGKSTTSSPETTTRPSESTPTQRPTTLALPPDQEPMFGGGASSTESPATTSNGEATETPTVPRSGPPPALESTAAADRTTTASPAAIESDVGQALSSTTPAGDSGSSRSTEAPATTTTEPTSSSSVESPPQTSTTTSNPAAETGAPVRPTGESDAPPATTTTTTTTAAPATTVTPAAPSEGSTVADEGGEREKEESGSGPETRKKRRGTLAAGVEYANESTAKKKKKTKKKLKPTEATITTAKANSSSVEYATS